MKKIEFKNNALLSSGILSGLFLVLVFLLTASDVLAVGGINLQCPETITDTTLGRTTDPYIACKHITGGDGFIRMADQDPPGFGYPNEASTYIFGFCEATAIPLTPAETYTSRVMNTCMLGAQFSAPTLQVREGDEFYLTLSNVGMFMRPDLFDPHSVHFHGFPNAASVFDGEPMASISVNMAASLTYYYNIVEPGTYMYHCHVEASEHMQMGMLGNLYVHPAQDGTSLGSCLGGPCTKFVYNDGDGSTGYDVEFPIQISAFDPKFHEADLTIQPLPFADMTDVYPMLNGRGYPDTVNSGSLLPPLDNESKISQSVSSLITASVGQKILVRLSSLATIDFYTVQVLGIPMRVVGRDARLLRGPTGIDLSYMTNSVTLGGGESADVILDTTGLSPGTYYLYTANLNHLSNNKEDFGGMMTEIRLN